MKEILLSVKCQFQNVWSLILEDFFGCHSRDWKFNCSIQLLKETAKNSTFDSGFSSCSALSLAHEYTSTCICCCMYYLVIKPDSNTCSYMYMYDEVHTFVHLIVLAFLGPEVKFLQSSKRI